MNVDTLRHEDYDLIGESDRILLEAADPVAFPAGKCMLRIYLCDISELLFEDFVFSIIFSVIKEIINTE